MTFIIKLLTYAYIYTNTHILVYVSEIICMRAASFICLLCSHLLAVDGRRLCLLACEDTSVGHCSTDLILIELQARIVALCKHKSKRSAGNNNYNCLQHAAEKCFIYNFIFHLFYFLYHLSRF